MVVLLFEKPLRVISIVAILAYTPTSNGQGFPFPAILTNTCFIEYSHSDWIEIESPRIFPDAYGF